MPKIQSMNNPKDKLDKLPDSTDGKPKHANRQHRRDSVTQSSAASAKQAQPVKRGFVIWRSPWLWLFVVIVSVVLTVTGLVLSPIGQNVFQSVLEPIAVLRSDNERLKKQVTALEQLRKSEHEKVIQQQKNLTVAVEDVRQMHEKRYKHLYNSVERIAQRQLQPSRLLLLVDNHLHLIEQQLVFDYSPLHIDRQLSVVEDMLKTMDGVAEVLAALQDFRSIFATVSHIDTEQLVSEIEQLSLLLQAEQKEPEAAALPVQTHQPIMAIIKQRLSQLVAVQKIEPMSPLQVFDSSQRVHWVQLHLELLKLRVWAHDWKLVRQQASDLRVWVRDNQPNWHEKMRPVLSKLEHVESVGTHPNLVEVRKVLQRVMQERGQ